MRLQWIALLAPPMEGVQEPVGIEAQHGILTVSLDTVRRLSATCV